MQVLPSRCHRTLARRLTVRSRASAFGYSLATITVYQILPSVERPPSDNWNGESDN